MPVVHYLTTVSINQIKLHSAELCTLAPVGRAVKTELRGIANTRVADAQGAVNEHLQFNIGHGLMDGCNLVKGKLARQNSAFKTEVTQPLHLLGSARVTLCRRMENGCRACCAQGCAAHGERCHILNQQSIGARLGQFINQALRTGQFLFVDDGVNGDINFSTVLMGIGRKAADIIDRITGCRPRAHAVGTNIHGVGTVVDGRTAAFQILCRGK